VEDYNWSAEAEQDAAVRIADYRYMRALDAIHNRAQVPITRNEADIFTYFQTLDTQLQRARDYLFLHRF
jgi:hypothetical protein